MADNTVKKYTDLFRLKKVPDNTIYQVEETGKYYQRKGHNWDEMTRLNTKSEISGPTIPLYELNQSSIMQFPVMDKDKIQNYIDKINNWYSMTGNTYYMLLSNKYNYYTVFNDEPCLSNPHRMSFGEAVIDIIKGFDKVYSISLDEDNNAWEIWATLKEDDKAPEIFYLFPYDTGVVQYG